MVAHIAERKLAPYDNILGKILDCINLKSCPLFLVIAKGGLGFGEML